MNSKNYFKQIFLISICSAILTGCATAPPNITLDSAKGLSSNQVVILRRDTENKRGVSMIGIADISSGYRSEILKIEPWNNYNEIKIAPGAYEVVLRAEGGYQQLPAFPRVRLQIKAGEIYYFRAVPVMDGAGVKGEYRVEKNFEAPSM